MKQRNKQQILDRLHDFDSKRLLSVDKTLIDIENRTIPFIMVSNHNEGERYDWWEDETYIEKLDVNGADTKRLTTFFKDHNRNVDDAIGRVENTRVDGGCLKCDVIFGTDEDSEKIFKKYQDGILTDVSIGYTINDVNVERVKGETPIVTVTDFSILELSAVGIGFDKGAKVGRSLEETPSEAKEIPLDIHKRRLKLTLKEK